MKNQTLYSNATTLGPFLKLMLALAEQRARTENETSRGATAGRPLPTVAITAAMGEVAKQKQPVCRSPIVLGPFLTMLLTLAEWKAAGQRPWLLRSSIVPASPRLQALAGGR